MRLTVTRASFPVHPFERSGSRSRPAAGATSFFPVGFFLSKLDGKGFLFYFLLAELIVAFELVNQRRNNPAADEQTNNQKPDCAEIQIADSIPETTLQIELVSDHAEHFDRTDDEGNQHRNERD